MSGQSPFVGTPIGYADTINGAGLALSGIDCGTGVRAGTKCFVATGLQYWTLTVSAAVVDHVNVEAALNFPAMRWILDTTPGGGTISSIASAGGTVTVTGGAGPAVNLEVTVPAPTPGGAPPAVAAAGAAGAAATYSRSDHTHQGVKSVTPGTGMTNSGTALDLILDVTPSGTVTSVASADGSIVVTNPNTTPDLSVRVLSAATPAALAAVVTVGKFQTGATALVAAVKPGGGVGVYVLQPAVSATPDSIFVVATSDDASKQWVSSLVALNSFVSLVTDEIDFTAVGNKVILPPLPFTMWASLTISVILTQRDGTVTVGPTMKAGTDAAFTNIVPATLQGFGASAVGSRTVLTGALSANTNALNPNGLVVGVTVGATLGTATVFKGRVVITVGLYN